MKSILILSVFFCLYSSTSQYLAVTRQSHTSPCDSTDINTKNALVEHFFNTVFTEFYSTPPVCVCVQMCPGHFTYCYPNGCLRPKSQEPSEETSKIPLNELLPSPVQRSRNQFSLTKDDSGDFMTELLEKYYEDDSKLSPQKSYSPLQVIRPDVFKQKYSYGHIKKIVPKVEISYSLKEKVRGPKSDVVRIESPDLSKSRWPMHKHIISIDGRRKIVADENPVYGKSSFFSAMLPDQVVEYPPKYFKRDVNKNTDSNDVDLKAIYVLEDALNVTEDNNYSLEKLIDALIRSTFNKNLETREKKESESNTKMATEKADIFNISGLVNETMNVISMNFTDEKVNKNKYVEETLGLNNTGNLTEMITYLTKQIEKQNNTTMEIAKTVIDNFNATTLELYTTDNLPTESNSISMDFVNISITDGSAFTAKALETTTLKNIEVTKKSRQRVYRKSPSSKIK